MVFIRKINCKRQISVLSFLFVIFVRDKMVTIMEAINHYIEDLLNMTGLSEGWIDIVRRAIVIVLMMTVAYLADWICRKKVAPWIKLKTMRTKNTWDDELLSEPVLNWICHLVPPIILYVWLPYAFDGMPKTMGVVATMCVIYIICVVIRLIYKFLDAILNIVTDNAGSNFKGVITKSTMQMMKLIITCIGAILVISAVVGVNPLKILTGLGASMAILSLVFKDSILGLVAGIQLSANKMLAPGDWIIVPSCNANGKVLEVTLTTVKVENWDKSVSTIPPYTLVSSSFQNWQRMIDSAGRRVTRSIYVDMTSVKFLSNDDISRLISRGFVNKDDLSGSAEVNLGLFRIYIERYLRQHADVNSDLLLMVRQLPTTPQGLPLEMYFFTRTTVWTEYERIQCEIFDYVLAVVNEFGLRVFQTPTGADISSLKA